MHFLTLLIIVICHTSLVFFKLPYPKQAFELPKYPSGWICTVHVTVASFANYTSSDIAERFLTTNHGTIIPTLSTMMNRRIRIAPVISFFEPSTISLLVHTTIKGSSYMFSPLKITRCIEANEYTYGGWRHSIITLMYFSCASDYHNGIRFLPHRLFYHSLDCGPHNPFPSVRQ
jgi:hypothetical protein